LPLGLVSTPLAALSGLCGESVEGGDGDGPDGRGRDQLESCEVDYVPLSSEPVADPERPPTPPPSSSPSFAAAVGSYYARDPVRLQPLRVERSISLAEGDVASGVMDAAARHSTVEYEVGGAYEVRRPVRNVHLYGVEYLPEPDGDGGGSPGGHHHHGTAPGYTFRETVEAVRAVGAGLANRAPTVELPDGSVRRAEARVGLFAFTDGCLVFPYLRRPRPARDGRGDAVGDGEGRTAGEDAPLGELLEVAVVSDVSDEPFCPLPIGSWTHDVGSGTDSAEYARFNFLLDSFERVMESICAESSVPRSGPRMNCGGAALSCLSSALSGCGGSATLVTTGRPTHGVGSIRDREGRGTGRASPYRRTHDEMLLYTPLQRLAGRRGLGGSNVEVNSDHAAGHFYRRLGEECASNGVAVSVVVANSAVDVPDPNDAGARTTVREYVDAATLGELCRSTGADSTGSASGTSAASPSGRTAAAAAAAGEGRRRSRPSSSGTSSSGPRCGTAAPTRSSSYARAPGGALGDVRGRVAGARSGRDQGQRCVRPERAAVHDARGPAARACHDPTPPHHDCARGRVPVGRPRDRLRRPDPDVDRRARRGGGVAGPREGPRVGRTGDGAGDVPYEHARGHGLVAGAARPARLP
ncbi:hypothetical protein THAOC_17773, partial [Thalassiosira oceanica]